METLSDYDFFLPENLIAQAPTERRDGARLLVTSRSSPELELRDAQVVDLPEQLRAGDLLVLNDTRVVPARLLGSKEGTGGKAEILLIRPDSERATSEALELPAAAMEWVCLGQSSKGLRAGQVIALSAGVRARVVGERGGGEYRVRFEAPGDVTLAGLLEEIGRLPLPPYVRRNPNDDDQERYQTLFASDAGSIAAPTAGLHFSKELLERVSERGVETVRVTLDVGPGTFMPVREEALDRHRMHSERYRVPKVTAERVQAAKAEGRRVVAVGTTVVRTLESATDEATGSLRSGAGESQLFIRPGYRFRQVDALMTNFHLPKSTLLMLVSAFLGYERTKAAYRHAVQRQYRFFSYGDAMWIGT